MATSVRRRFFAIGDVHGCAIELGELLSRLPLGDDSCVVFLGDYVDRGNFARETIDLILELKRKVPVIALKGNHEDMMLDFLDHPESHGAGMFILNGGSSTLASYDDGKGGFSIPEEHLAFFRGLKLFYETDDYFFVHAGVPDLPLAQVKAGGFEKQLLWIRQPFLGSRYDWGKVIVHGHSPAMRPEIHANRINVDTGCVYDGMLTAVELPSGKFYSVEKGVKSEQPRFLKDLYSGRVARRFTGAIAVTLEKNGVAVGYETLNYNEFGLLIRETAGQGPSLAVNEAVNGWIGPADQKLQFEGFVVRTETRDGAILYGIKITRLQKNP